MARQPKPVDTISAAMSKQAKANRKAIESAVRGSDDELVEAPDYLSEPEKQVYNWLLAELKPVRILSNVDLPVLERFSTAVVRLREIEAIVRECGVGAMTREMVSIKSSYVRDFDAGVKELALSPQARAKIGTLTIAAAEKNADPVAQLLEGVANG